MPSPIQLPVKPLAPIPWNIHRQEYPSMEMYQEPLVVNPLEDPDSPMEDAPPLEPEPVTPMNQTSLKVICIPCPPKSHLLSHGRDGSVIAIVLCPTSTPYYLPVPLLRLYNNIPVRKAVTS